MVEEKEFVMGEIESFLCREGISYVKVENEIHCPGLILRFFDFEECQSLYFLDLEDKIESFSLSGIYFAEVKKDETDSRFLSYFRHENIPSEMMIKALGISKKEKPSPYPPIRNNKKKQLQMENGRIMKKIK